MRGKRGSAGAVAAAEVVTDKQKLKGNIPAPLKDVNFSFRMPCTSKGPLLLLSFSRNIAAKM